MTLINVDPQPQGGISPSIDAVDINNNRMAHATHGISYRAVGTQTGPRITQKNDIITVNDGTYDRIVIGRLPDGSYGFAVSKPGHDVSEIFI